MRRADGGAESEEARQQREESQRCLERGELPLGAVARLRSAAGATAAPGAARRPLFTSDFSAQELALVRQAGGEPLGQVLGSTIYFIGSQWRTPNWRDSDRGRAFGYELDVVTQGFAQARQLALGRLRQEAALLGATGVVGVRLHCSRYAEADSLFEFAALGTAIKAGVGSWDLGVGAGKVNDKRLPISPQLPAPNSQLPFLSHLSGQEYWLLRQAGHRPLGLVIGNCAYYQIPAPQSLPVLNSAGRARGQCREVAEYSQALSQSRTLALERIAAEARALGAEGVVGVRIEIDARPGPAQDGSGSLTGMLCHFTAIGTAIAPDPSAAPAGKISAAIRLR